MKTVKAGILGIGNVGTGTYRTLQLKSCWRSWINVKGGETHYEP